MQQDKQHKPETIATAHNDVVYIVTSRVTGGLGRRLPYNDLARSFARVVRVHPGAFRNESDQLVVPPWPNPVGLLGLIGLKQLQASLDQWLLFPGRAKLFLWAVRRRLAQAISADLRQRKMVSVLIVTPEHANSLLAPYLRRRCPGARIVIDWQDLWSYDEAYFLRAPRALRARLRNLERKAMASADVNLTTNFKAAEVLKTIYGLPVERVAFINHHYLPQDAQQPAPIQDRHPNRKRPIKIGFLGTLFKPPKVPGNLIFQALDKVAERGVPVTFHLFGDQTDAAKSAAESMQHAVVKIHARTSHAEAMQNVACCDLLLIALADQPNCLVIMHSKLSHYLLLNKPILAFVPRQSFVAHVVESTGTGTVIDSGADWASALETMLSSFRAGEFSLQRNEAEIAKYAWENIRPQWIEVLSGTQISNDSNPPR